MLFPPSMCNRWGTNTKTLQLFICSVIKSSITDSKSLKGFSFGLVLHEAKILDILNLFNCQTEDAKRSAEQYCAGACAQLWKHDKKYKNVGWNRTTLRNRLKNPSRMKITGAGVFLTELWNFCATLKPKTHRTHLPSWTS